jgi:hypothetical protein
MNNIIDSNFEENMKEFLRWGLKTFQYATTIGSIDKAIDEAKEIKKAINDDASVGEVTLEFVDCMMALFIAAAKYGITFGDLNEALAFKFKVNRSRKWEFNLKTQNYSHVK